MLFTSDCFLYSYIRKQKTESAKRIGLIFKQHKKMKKLSLTLIVMMGLVQIGFGQVQKKNEVENNTNSKPISTKSESAKVVTLKQETSKDSLKSTEANFFIQGNSDSEASRAKCLVCAKRHRRGKCKG
jgi:hypothetical protein